MNRKSSKKSFFSKPLVLVALAVVLIATTIGATVAFLTSTGSVTNTFSPAHVSVSIDEKTTGSKDNLTAKDEVTFTNTSDIPVWIRATAVYSWLDPETKHTVAVPVESRDVSATIEAGWLNGPGGFSYYYQPVAPGDTITYLTNCVVSENSANGKLYKLDVDILVEAIQAAGTDAITETWLKDATGITVNSDMSELTKIN